MKCVTVTNDLLQQFVGGHMEILENRKAQVFVGEVESIICEEKEEKKRVRFRLKWLARKEGSEKLVRWVAVDDLDCDCQLLHWHGHLLEGKLHLLPCGSDEMIILSPPRATKEPDAAMPEGL